MPARYDPELGTVFETDEEGNPITRPVVEPSEAPASSFEGRFEDPLLTQRRQQVEQAELLAQQEAGRKAVDDRPFISPAILTDSLKAPFNAIAGIPTDIVDLGLGLVDTARAAAGSAGLPEELGGMEWNQVFDDRDNPLTAFRRDTVGQMDTQAGALINQTTRLIGTFYGFKWLYNTPLVFSKIQRISKLVQAIPGINKAYRSAGVTQKLASGLNAANRASRGRAVFSQAVSNPYLTTTFKSIANLPETAGWWKGTANAARALVKTKITPRNLAETLAWDLFTSFNTFGEGEDDLDETLFDFANDIGIPVPEVLRQSPLDTSIARKAKGMLDGTLFAGVGGLLIDVFRIQRFRRAFDAATPSEKKDIVRAFQASAEELGNGVGSESMRVQAALSRVNGVQGPQSFPQSELDPFGAAPSPINRLTADAPPPLPDDVDPWLDTGGQLARLDDVRGKQESVALAQTEDYIQAVDVSVVGPRPDQPALQSSLDVIDARVRVDEPTISPGGIRKSVEDSLALGVPADQIVTDVRRMLPQKRLGLIDYIQLNPPQKNEYGMLSVADQMWSDYIIGAGLKEGWARLGPDFKPVFIRSIAREQDIGGMITKQAQALDELQQIRDLQSFGETRPKPGGTETTRGINEDPAAADAQVQATDAALNANAISDEEFSRRAAEVTADDPDELIRQFEGIDPDDLGVEIQKAETGRGWIVYGPDGEPIQNGRFTTKRAAQKAADAENRRIRQALAERAQQKAVDDTGETLTLTANDIVRDGTLTDKVALTQPQINELIRYPNFKPIFDQFGLNKKTYEFTQGDMADLVDGARALLQTGQVKGPRARVLTKLIDKFETAIQRLEPAVRAQRQADSIIAETKRVTNHGDYCT